ncbi:sigma-70 family RNA polymerase sigma factor [Mucilaginibacter sp. SMC90]|uniref:RNA polymerase sigma factor n=1 Tax=Mucilaginibacter sp. SMC90 TaxID=2929803 RepID=UPI001FB3AAF0|nr:sigma-70 family RNA polymerase sigma factor [Mucilaginibacter sp. SMC90]UOE50603.1 sigma-70 family RNA polymerase sigma factor [Mucilaginibacter sp. SMC90]
MAKASLSDEELWQRITAGDGRSFALFYDRYWLRMYKAALFYLKDTSASEEVVQEVFVIIWNKRQTLNINNFAAYLNSVTRYEVYRRLKMAKHSLIDFYEEFPATGAVVYNMGYERLTELDHEFMMQECLKELPKRCREIFQMSKMQHLSNTEIASLLEISKHTVENQLAIATKHLKQNIDKVAIFALLLIRII